MFANVSVQTQEPIEYGHHGFLFRIGNRPAVADIAGQVIGPARPPVGVRHIQRSVFIRLLSAAAFLSEMQSFVDQRGIQPAGSQPIIQRIRQTQQRRQFFPGHRLFVQQADAIPPGLFGSLQPLLRFPNRAIERLIGLAQRQPGGQSDIGIAPHIAPELLAQIGRQGDGLPPRSDQQQIVATGIDGVGVGIVAP